MIKLTPPLGWNSWNTFGANIDEELIKKSADAMVESGLKDCGYEYVVIDDCWAEMKRDENHRLVASKTKFPGGMKAVADYVHGKGLKFGMYSCAGPLTCAGYPASYEHEFIDAQTFAEWGVDLLKYDYCYHSSIVPGHILYKRMGLALANCGRDILFSACSWGADDTKEWIKSTGAHMWRSTGDINDSWESIKSLALSQLPVQAYNGLGSFNDMDMLVVGMHAKGLVGLKGCSDTEYRTHFSLWALVNSPLMIGCDIREMSEETKKILMNKDVLAINQDAAGRQPYMLGSDMERPIIAKHLENGDIAIGLFNLGDNDVYMHFSPEMLGLSISTGKTLKLTELWTQESETIVNGLCFHTMKPHDCRIYRAVIEDAE